MCNKRIKTFTWGIGIVLLLFCSIRPARGFSKVEIMRRKSNEILREIGVAVLMWQDEHEASHPVGLADVLPKNDETRNSLLHSPSIFCENWKDKNCIQDDHLFETYANYIIPCENELGILVMERPCAVDGETVGFCRRDAVSGEMEIVRKKYSDFAASLIVSRCIE